jgi:CRP/FNR family cyclic AMP-dependent transcriptional regulator
MRELSFLRGTVIFGEGDRSTDAYVVKQGRVELRLQLDTERQWAVVETGGVFGEIALLTDQPRVNSAVAVDDTVCDVVSQQEFMNAWHTNPDGLLPVVRSMFERLRHAMSLAKDVVHHDDHHASLAAATHVVESTIGHPPGADAATVTLAGLTKKAIDVLNGATLALERFPYRMGRSAETGDPLACNDLVLPDEEPFHISRNHCMVVHASDRFFVIDRGSHLGTMVDGKMLGGHGNMGRVEVSHGEHEIALGSPQSSYRFRLHLA